MPSPRILWQPDTTTRQNSHLNHYMQWLGQHHNLHFKDYESLWQWSVDHLEDFWQSLWNYFDIIGHGNTEKVLSGREMPDFQWFKGQKINYAEHIFRKKSAQQPAIIFQSEQHSQTTISWAELEQQTAAFAHFLKQSGIKPGDRVAAFLPNSPHAIVAALACMSVGAVWSSCSPDFGAASIADRFAQIEPRIFIAVDGYAYGGKSFDKSDVVRDVCARLTSVEKVVWVPFLQQAPTLPADLPNAITWGEIMSQDNVSPLQFEALPFSHPIWVLYSSGTTGVPKAITHSHGGNLLEHLKYLHFHNDVHTGERFFWYSTTGWMMWNFTLAALLAGATIVLYDGSPGFPDLNVLWALAEQTRITHFGTSAPFLVGCMKNGIKPSTFDLSSLRSIGSTGSPLPPEAFAWVYENVKQDLWLSSMAGGTDVCTAWVGGNPLLPLREGEIQCRCLGCAMEAWDEDGHAVPTGEVGEMVVTKPMPSMPVYFWNDPDGSKYRSSYFEQYPGVWRHGDWLRLSPHSDQPTPGLQILGRSDATLNRQGVRIGTAEIYRALDQIPALQDSLIINMEYADGTDWMPLFVLLKPGQMLDAALINTIKTTLRTTYSPRHVPDEIIPVPDIPYTISGKKMETPVKKVFQGKPLEKAYNKDSMRNPEAMAFFIEMAAARK
ncbi:MAG: acetoacetate--CoA ligase [Saprospiraceae bacterium]|nr:acetoacetate--CoA ligase [Saprospiraceae bacterium]